ncbi:MAG: serine/threonine-protein kinase, partial [Vicinamibacterales bacterium]
GGMGEVYLANDPRIGRDVVVKVIRSGLETDELRERFVREARAAGNLTHKNIVTVFDVAEDVGRPFIVMEHVRGRTLSEFVRSQDEVSLPRKLAILEELCDALHCAHQAGIIHRDVKPSNVMIDEAGVVKVLDFGIARPLVYDTITNLTDPQVIMGTTGYMAPEVILGGVLDARCDMFSTAAVAYELLMLEPPFGTGPDAARKATLGELAPMRGVPSNVEAIVLKGLAPKPADRYADLSVMGSAFKDARLATAPRVVSPSWRQASAALTVIALVALGSFFWRSSGGTPDTTTALVSSDAPQQPREIFGVGSANVVVEPPAPPVAPRSVPKIVSAPDAGATTPAMRQRVTPTGPVILNAAAVASRQPLVLVVNQNHGAQRQITSVVARALVGNGGAFLPEFMKNDFAATYSGDSRALRAVEAIEGVPLILLAVSRSSSDPNIFEGLRRANLAMDVRVFRPVAGFATDMLHVDAVGAGFSDADALSNAAERAADQLKNLLK